MASLGVPELLVVCAIVAGGLVIAWPAARICSRVGFSPWLGILSVVPIANVLLLWFIALAAWPLSTSAPGGLADE